MGEFHHWSSPQTVADGHCYPSVLTLQQGELYVGPTQSPRSSSGIELQLSITVTSIITHLLLAAFSSPSTSPVPLPVFSGTTSQTNYVFSNPHLRVSFWGKLNQDVPADQPMRTSFGQQPGLVQNFAECWARDFSSGQVFSEHCYQ